MSGPLEKKNKKQATRCQTTKKVIKKIYLKCWMYLSTNDIFNSGEVPENVWGRVLLHLALFLLFLVPYYIFFKLLFWRVFSGSEEIQFTQFNSVLLLSLMESAEAALCNFIVDSISWTVCHSVEIQAETEVWSITINSNCKSSSIVERGWNMGGTRDQLVGGFVSLCPWFCWNFYNTISSEIASWLYFQLLSIFSPALGKILASFRPRLHLIYLSASIDILFVCPSLFFFF